MQLIEAQQTVSYSMGDPPPPPHILTTIINDAGQWFCGAHDWNFLMRGPALVDLRATIAVSGGIWSPSARSLQSVGTFANYQFLTGDQIIITSGTGVTVGSYVVEDKFSDDVIILATSLGLATTDVAGEMKLPWARLPDDFAEMLPGFPVGGPGTGITVDMVDSADTEGRRATTQAGTTAAYLCAVTQARPVGGGVSVPRLNHYPECTGGQPGAFSIMYRSSMFPVTSAVQEFDMPRWAEPAFRETLRAFARGVEEEDEGTVTDRLEKLVQGALWAQAVDQDSRLQTSFGPVERGAFARAIGRVGVPIADFDIQGPM